MAHQTPQYTVAPEVEGVAPPAAAPPAPPGTSALDLIDVWWDTKRAYERHCDRCYRCPDGYLTCDVGRELRRKAVIAAGKAGAVWL